jgi:hypothetical protein
LEDLLPDKRNFKPISRSATGSLPRRYKNPSNSAQIPHYPLFIFEYTKRQPLVCVAGDPTILVSPTSVCKISKNQVLRMFSVLATDGIDGRPQFYPGYCSLAFCSINVAENWRSSIYIVMFRPANAMLSTLFFNHGCYDVPQFKAVVIPFSHDSASTFGMHARLQKYTLHHHERR